MTSTLKTEIYAGQQTDVNTGLELDTTVLIINGKSLNGTRAVWLYKAHNYKSVFMFYACELISVFSVQKKM